MAFRKNKAVQAEGAAMADRVGEMSNRTRNDSYGTRDTGRDQTHVTNRITHLAEAAAVAADMLEG